MAKNVKKAIKKVTPQEASSAIGYGYSPILVQLFSEIDLPLQNMDEKRTAYKEMLDEDETIGAGLEYLIGRVASRIGEYSHEDPRIKDLVDKCIENIRGTLTNARRSILRDAFGYGYGVAEFTIEAVNGQWLLSSMPTLDPNSISLKMARFPDNSFGVGSIVQTDAHGQEIDIPLGKCLYFRYGSERTPYGQSILHRCYRWWRFKRTLPKFWAVALERFGQPALHAKASSGDAAKKLENGLRELNSKGWFVTDLNCEIDAIATNTSSGVGVSYVQAEEQCDKLIYRSLFLPSLLVSGENGGSYSLGRVHLDLFNSTCAALAEDYADAELEQLWRPIIEWNFGPQENYGKISITDTIPTEEKKTLADMFGCLAEKGFIDADSDRSWVREALRLPEPKEGQVFLNWPLAQKDKNSKPGDPDEPDETEPDGILSATQK